jgi:hypothetical protein
MRKFTTTLLLVSTLVAGAMAAPLLYAQPSGSMMGHGMMGDKNTNDKGGMMGMMKQMSCPNDQWRRTAPSTPEDKSG